MKKTRMIMMMTAALLTAVQFAACDSSLADIVAGQKAIDAEKQNAEILSWVFTISPDIYPGGINQDSRIITAVVPSAVVQGNTAIAAQVALSEGATIEPNPATAVSYPPKGVTYTVTSKGGFSQTYTVKVSGSSSIPGLTVDPPTAVELG
ncbi:MAG: DUF4971 domain-containing protein, partial [Spirochaetaceae bacterium]|nr:DUF4971 domain-containing protein [Spirochaetaceae bacterium]